MHGPGKSCPPALAPSSTSFRRCYYYYIVKPLSFFVCNPCLATCEFCAHCITASVEHCGRIKSFHAYKKGTDLGSVHTILPLKRSHSHHHHEPLGLTPDAGTTHRHGGHLWRCHCTHCYSGCLRAVPRGRLIARHTMGVGVQRAISPDRGAEGPIQHRCFLSPKCRTPGHTQCAGRLLR